MYLCVDSTKAPRKGEEKLVYGYINGQKTACMPEFDFLALYNRQNFDSSRAVADSAMLAQSGRNDILNLIRKGKRDLAGVDLKAYDLMKVDLSGANLKGANLQSADMRQAVLHLADCSGADFTSAFLKKADFSKATLTGAKLKGAYLMGANLIGVKGLTVADLKDVKTLYEAKLDTTLKAAVEEEYPEKLEKPKKCWENNSWAGDRECDEEKNAYPMPKD
jgi:hypothetical protein